MKMEHFDRFFRESSIPMRVYDPVDYTIKDVNQAMIDLYGYSREEMLSFTLFDLHPREDVPKLKEHLSKVDNYRIDDEGLWRHEKKNGEFIYARVIRNPVTFEGDEQVYQLAMYKDVTSELNYQQRYEMLFEHSLDGIILAKPDGVILEANQAACDMLGMTEEEIIDRGRQGIVAGDEKLVIALKEQEETGRFSGEVNYIHKSGDKIPVEITSSVFTSYGGEKQSNIIFRDISRRKQNEDALRQEKEFTDVVLNNLPGVFYVLDREGTLLRCNDRSTEVFGLPREEILGRSAADFVHDADKEKVPEHIQTVLEEGYVKFELTLNVAGGEEAVYRFNAERLEQNGQIYIIGNGVDVTKQKKLEKQLSSSLQKEHTQRRQAEADRDKLKEMFEEAPSPKCVLEGSDLRYVIANKAYRNVVGQENIVGKRVIDVIPEVEDQGYIDILENVYRTGEPYLGQENRIDIEKDQENGKEEYIFNLLFAPLFDEDDDVYGIFVEALDFSEQITYQDRLEESLKEKETLLTEIHHRVKNNLAIVTSMMEMQAMDSDNELLREAFKTGQQRIQTIATIHELLYNAESLSHLNFGKNIEELVRNIKKMYNSGKNIRVDLQVDPVPLNVNQAIPCALLVNEVLTNAYKHAFKNKEQGVIELKLRENNGLVTLEIKDNGSGIPDELIKGSASTIGLTLIKLLKQQLQGEVDLANHNGTQFRLAFEKTDVNGIGSNLIGKGEELMTSWDDLAP